MNYCGGKDVLENQPNCKALFEKVQNFPGVKKYLSTSKKPRFWIKRFN